MWTKAGQPAVPGRGRLLVHSIKEFHAYDQPQARFNPVRLNKSHSNRQRQHSHLAGRQSSLVTPSFGPPTRLCLLLCLLASSLQLVVKTTIPKEWSPSPP